MAQPKTTSLTVERLRHVLDYNGETGTFTWKNPASRGRKPGQVAGGKPHPNGYLYIRVDSENYRAHRLAWFYVHGEWPKQEIDHINQDKLDNRIANLRDVSHQENRQNLRKPNRTNRVGALGVNRRTKNCYRARLVVDGELKTIGHYSTAEAAADAYNDAKNNSGSARGGA